ncbi:hypothetical protein DFH07DRAFT_771534 [Mycena maculata]|uniref:Uncharacterized protein n=1 Tax=Mycena maculata TaxID=230809 RepID=A0AAD7JDI7_9AGAR|nr:hypothetical protein DFH07DRAFT_771534 [Mycena maculata]
MSYYARNNRSEAGSLEATPIKGMICRGFETPPVSAEPPSSPFVFPRYSVGYTIICAPSYVVHFRAVGSGIFLRHCSVTAWALGHFLGHGVTAPKLGLEAIASAWQYESYLFLTILYLQEGSLGHIFSQCDTIMVPDKPTIIYEKRTKMNTQGKTIPELEIVMQGNSAMPTHTAAYITATALFPRHKFKFSKLATDAKGNSVLNSEFPFQFQDPANCPPGLLLVEGPIQL